MTSRIGEVDFILKFKIECSHLNLITYAIYAYFEPKSAKLWTIFTLNVRLKLK